MAGTPIGSSVAEILNDPWIEDLMLRTDLAYFAETVLNLQIADHHKEWSKLCAKYKRLCINSPRDHGKSYFWCFAYAIWRAYFRWMPNLKDVDPKLRPKIPIGYIFSNTLEQAMDHLRMIQEEVLSNPKLRHLVPSGKGSGGMPAGWNKKQIKFSNGFMLRASGWGARVRGGHPVFAICDDILNDETIYSELVRAKQIDYFYSAVTPMVIKGGQIIVVGTPFHAQDLYNGSLKENTRYVFVRYPAISEDGKERALWPGRYTLSDLKHKQSEIGSVRFAREFMCTPISDESSLFPERILNPCKDLGFNMPTHLTREDHDELAVYTGVDFAMSATVGADYTALITIGVDKYGRIWLLNIQRHKGLGLTEQLKRIETVNSAYRPNRIFVEDNNFQAIFRDELVTRTSIPVTGFTTGVRKNSLESGVPSLQILFENRKVVIPWRTDFDKEWAGLLLGELKSFSWMNGKLQGVGAHDDLVMALWIAIEASRDSKFAFSFT